MSSLEEGLPGQRSLGRGWPGPGTRQAVRTGSKAGPCQDATLRARTAGRGRGRSGPSGPQAFRDPRPAHAALSHWTCPAGKGKHQKGQGQRVGHGSLQARPEVGGVARGPAQVPLYSRLQALPSRPSSMPPRRNSLVLLLRLPDTPVSCQGPVGQLWVPGSFSTGPCSSLTLVGNSGSCALAPTASQPRTGLASPPADHVDKGFLGTAGPGWAQGPRRLFWQEHSPGGQGRTA